VDGYLAYAQSTGDSGALRTAIFSVFEGVCIAVIGRSKFTAIFSVYKRVDTRPRRS
jgi:hypothetical protein